MTLLLCAGLACAALAAAPCLAADPVPLEALLSSKVIDDPVSPSGDAKLIPGSTVEFTLGVSNRSALIAPPTGLVIAQAVPDQLSLYVGDLAALGSGPVEFVEGPIPSGLAYSFASLADLADSIEFSSNGGLTYDHQPSPDSQGIDTQVTHFRVRLIGAMALRIGAAPSFSIRYRTRMK